MLTNDEVADDTDANMRSPICVIMGHVDTGRNWYFLAHSSFHLSSQERPNCWIAFDQQMSKTMKQVESPSKLVPPTSLPKYVDSSQLTVFRFFVTKQGLSATS